MLYLDGPLGLALLVLWIFSLSDVMTADAEECRNLSKRAWLLIVLLLSAIGSVVWLAAGRPVKPENLPFRGAHDPRFMGPEPPRSPKDPEPDQA